MSCWAFSALLIRHRILALSFASLNQAYNIYDGLGEGPTAMLRVFPCNYKCYSAVQYNLEAWGYNQAETNLQYVRAPLVHSAPSFRSPGTPVGFEIDLYLYFNIGASTTLFENTDRVSGNGPVL